MNIVRISAGLGNQMFQYAFYKGLKEHYPDTKMDISEFTYRKHHNGYELERIFHIKPVYATKKECNFLADLSKDLLSEIRRKLFKIKLPSKGELINEGEIGTFYHPELAYKQNAYFQGFWQTEKYFLFIQEKIREDFSFKINLDDENKLIANRVINSNSVSIHIRRGDYVKERRMPNIGSICSLKYYERAINYINLHVDNPSFFIFSDDISWVKENLKVGNATYVDINKGESSYKDLQLMSICKHNIIANSSFSWWGAWLNGNSEKIVIAPEIWFRNDEMPDILPLSWVRMEI